MEKLFYDSSESDNGYEIKNKHENCADQNSVKDGIMFKDINKNEYLVGTMPINKSDKFKIDPLPNKNKYTISKGYHDGTGIVYTGDLREYTYGNATEDMVANNKIFWVNGERKVGTLNIDNIKQEATATPDDILINKTAWVNGKKIIGTIDYHTHINPFRISKGDIIRLEPGVYTNPIEIYGIYDDRLDLSGTDAYAKESTLYPNSSCIVKNDTLVSLV